MALHRLTYVSTAKAGLTAADIEEIVETARQRNGELDVTGLLLFNGLNFLQTLEGEEAKLRALITRIAADPRHHGLVIVADHACDKRVFATWTMGYSELQASTRRPAHQSGNGFSQAHISTPLPAELVSLYSSFDTLSGG